MLRAQRGPASPGKAASEPATVSGQKPREFVSEWSPSASVHRRGAGDPRDAEQRSRLHRWRHPGERRQGGLAHRLEPGSRLGGFLVHEDVRAHTTRDDKPSVLAGYKRGDQTACGLQGPVARRHRLVPTVVKEHARSPAFADVFLHGTFLRRGRSRFYDHTSPVRRPVNLRRPS